eukprot:TCONS_00063275-protein
MDDLDELLDGLTEEELLAIDAEFDPNDEFIEASSRKLEEKKEREFEKRDVVETLENMLRQKHSLSVTPKSKDSSATSTSKPTIPWSQRNKTESTPNSAVNSLTTNSARDSSVLYSSSVSSMKSEGSENSSSSKWILSEEEDEVFSQLTEEELLEIAELADRHPILTQERSKSVDSKPSKLPRDFDPIKGLERRMMSMSDDDADLDSTLLLDCLRNDSEEIYHVRINNITLEKAILLAIFDTLKTTKTMRHLSLAGIHFKDEEGLLFNEAMKENTTIETLNLESNELTNICIEPLCEILETHPAIREFKCSHQKHGLGSRGEEAMARALNKNERLLKISYPFKVPSARSVADRCQIRNGEILRQKRTKGEDFYNYKEEIKQRDAHVQPWIKVQTVDKNEQMKSDLADQRGRMKSVGSVSQMRAESKLRARENAKPTMDNELASKLSAARKSRGRSIKAS